MKIIDNFLTKEDHLFIKNTLLGSYFPWYINSITKEVGKQEDGKEFSHGFYTKYSPSSEFLHILNPIIETVNPKALIRIRAVCMPRRHEQKEFGWHVDFDFPCTTAIYYVNTNNGYTKFKDGTIVESVANRFVSFESDMEHLGTHCTDQNFRCLINFNYFD
jgi:hypothetical protein